MIDHLASARAQLPNDVRVLERFDGNRLLPRKGVRGRTYDLELVLAGYEAMPRREPANQ
jgi:hypothetical protein